MGPPLHSHCALVASQSGEISPLAHFRSRLVVWQFDVLPSTLRTCTALHGVQPWSGSSREEFHMLNISDPHSQPSCSRVGRSVKRQ